MTNYLFDTNHASWLMARQAHIVARLRQSQAAGDQFGIPVTAARVEGKPVPPPTYRPVIYQALPSYAPA